MTDVIQSRAHLMQQISDHVRNGYRSWLIGTVPIERATAWAHKARTLYRTDEDRNRRARAKKHACGCAYLLLYPLDRCIQNPRLGWILLVTDGLHSAHTAESLKRAEDTPLELFGYTLVREPRPRRERPVWTWRMSRETYHDWRDRIVDTVRRGSPHDIRQMLRTLQGAPGFSGTRRQIKSLHRLMRNEWIPTHGKRKTQPEFPKIWYCRRMSVVRVPLDTYLRALASVRSDADFATPEVRPVAIHSQPDHPDVLFAHDQSQEIHN